MKVCATRPVELYAGADELGEGPAWLPDGRVLWVDIVRGALFGYDLDAGTLERRDFGRAISAVLPRAGGGLVVAADDGLLLLDAAGALERQVPVDHDVASQRLGDMATDPNGRLWFGTLDRDLAVGRGAVYRVEAGGDPVRVLDRLSIPNGIGWSRDGTLMYFIDSATGRVDVLDYDVATGEAAERRPWVAIEDADGLPDGLAVDAEGGVWVALWGGAQVRRFTPSGELDVVVPLPVRNVTSCCFGAADLSRLYITTARVEMTERELLAEPGAGSIFVVEPGFTGAPVPAFGG